MQSFFYEAKFPWESALSFNFHYPSFIIMTFDIIMTFLRQIKSLACGLQMSPVPMTPARTEMIDRTVGRFFSLMISTTTDEKREKKALTRIESEGKMNRRDQKCRPNEAPPKIKPFKKQK